jgi:hypothetical protein
MKNYLNKEYCLICKICMISARERFIQGICFAKEIIQIEQYNTAAKLDTRILLK